MARVLFKPEEGTPAVQSQFGIEFGPEPVEVSNPIVLSKMRGSPFYEVLDEEPSASGLEAVHKGRGKFSILDGGDVLIEGLGKPDADAFNALSAEDRAEYVKAHKAE